jgi:UDP:flavonoid glycosyltransferase YjiC (YdhE family)
MTIEQQIRAGIKDVLATKVTKANSPKVYEAIQTEQGYKAIEEIIINKLVSYGFSISGCIPHIEREM